MDGRKVGAPPQGTAWIAKGTAARLGIAKGGRIAIGGVPVTVGGIIQADPEQMSEGFALGALLAAEWLPGRHGVFGMKELLGL